MDINRIVYDKVSIFTSIYKNIICLCQYEVHTTMDSAAFLKSS